MNKRIGIVIAVCGLVVAGLAIGQGRILDMVANKVITKYQTRPASSFGRRRASPSRRRNKRRSSFCATIRRHARRSSTRSQGPSSTRCSSAEWFPEIAVFQCLLDKLTSTSGASRSLPRSTRRCRRRLRERVTRQTAGLNNVRKILAFSTIAEIGTGSRADGRSGARRCIAYRHAIVRCRRRGRAMFRCTLLALGRPACSAAAGGHRSRPVMAMLVYNALIAPISVISASSGMRAACSCGRPSCSTPRLRRRWSGPASHEGSRKPQKRHRLDERAEHRRLSAS